MDLAIFSGAEVDEAALAPSDAIQRVLVAGLVQILRCGQNACQRQAFTWGAAVALTFWRGRVGRTDSRIARSARRWQMR